jgi:hypothetical protein
MNSIQEFQQKGYVHLKDFLNKDNCKDLTNELNRLVKEKKTIQDEQCPKSQAIHGALAFDRLLEQLLPHFEAVSGLKLYPTYSYARLYSEHGEKLEIHQDRPACEISASITLGFEGDVWSIYMGDHEDKTNGTKIDMDIGDAVMYRGCDKWHWREPYTEGKWQAQVFLHYVDQNGPHVEWKYDKRKKSNQLSDCYWIENVIPKEVCERIIQEYTKPSVEKILPYINEEQLDLDVRNVQRVMMPLHGGIGATLTSIGLNLNQERWQYNITHSNQSEFLIYDINGKYITHVDTFHEHSNETRKLTILAFLNDDFEGGKFYIQNFDKRLYPKQTPGTILVFPSFMPHGVEPVIKGKRFSVVTWMVGPYFK